MRLGLILLLCLLNTGCALWRRDREEPVENGPRQEKAEPVLKPSEALKPKSLELASPVSDLFYVRGTYFQGTVDTVLRVDTTGATEPNGTVLSGEDDLGLDDVVDQARMEFDIRMGERNHMRIDYFKLDRFSQQVLPRDIDFGDFSFDEGDEFRAKPRLANVVAHLHIFIVQVRTLRSRRRAGTAHHRDECRGQRTRHAQSREGFGSRYLPHHRGEWRVPHLQALGDDRARPVVLGPSRGLRWLVFRLPRRRAVSLAQEFRRRSRLHRAFRSISKWWTPTSPSSSRWTPAALSSSSAPPSEVI